MRPARSACARLVIRGGDVVVHAVAEPAAAGVPPAEHASLVDRARVREAQTDRAPRRGCWWWSCVRRRSGVPCSGISHGRLHAHVDAVHRPALRARETSVRAGNARNSADLARARQAVAALVRAGVDARHRAHSATELTDADRAGLAAVARHRAIRTASTEATHQVRGTVAGVVAATAQRDARLAAEREEREERGEGSLQRPVVHAGERSTGRAHGQSSGTSTAWACVSASGAAVRKCSASFAPQQ